MQDTVRSFFIMDGAANDYAQTSEIPAAIKKVAGFKMTTSDIEGKVCILFGSPARGYVVSVAFKDDKVNIHYYLQRAFADADRAYEEWFDESPFGEYYYWLESEEFVLSQTVKWWQTRVRKWVIKWSIKNNVKE